MRKGARVGRTYLEEGRVFECDDPPDRRTGGVAQGERLDRDGADVVVPPTLRTVRSLQEIATTTVSDVVRGLAQVHWDVRR